MKYVKYNKKVLANSRETLACSMRICIVAAVLFGMSGCAQFRVVADERNPSEAELSESVCGWTWNFEGGHKRVRVAQEQSLGAVSIHSSYLKAWGTVLSFGAWQPFDVIYEINDDKPAEVK